MESQKIFIQGAAHAAHAHHCEMQIGSEEQELHKCTIIVCLRGFWGARRCLKSK